MCETCDEYRPVRQKENVPQEGNLLSHAAAVQVLVLGELLYLLWQRLLQCGQGSVGVTGVGLQGLHSVFQVPQLLVFVPQLLLQVFNLTQGRGDQEESGGTERERVHTDKQE